MKIRPGFETTVAELERDRDIQIDLLAQYKAGTASIGNAIGSASHEPPDMTDEIARVATRIDVLTAEIAKYSRPD